MALSKRRFYRAANMYLENRVDWAAQKKSFCGLLGLNFPVLRGLEAVSVYKYQLRSLDFVIAYCQMARWRNG